MLLREAIDVEAADAGDVVAQIVLTSRQARQVAAGQRGVRHDAIAGDDVVTPSPTATTSQAASAPTVRG